MNNNIFDYNLRTQRLILRRLKITDDKNMYEYTSDKRVTRYLEWQHHTKISQTISFIENVIEEYDTIENAYLWAIELISESKLIGVVRIYDYSPQNKRAEISYIMNPAYQGNGYIGEAIDSIFDYCFNTLKINRIQAKCFSNNTASEKVMKKTGMLHEGIMRKYVYIDGQYEDALLYAITEESYRNQINH